MLNILYIYRFNNKKNFFSSIFRFVCSVYIGLKELKLFLINYGEFFETNSTSLPRRKKTQFLDEKEAISHLLHHLFLLRGSVFFLMLDRYSRTCPSLLRRFSCRTLYCVLLMTFLVLMTRTGLTEDRQDTFPDNNNSEIFIKRYQSLITNSNSLFLSRLFIISFP